MNAKYASLGALLVASLMVGVAAGHPHEYLNPNPSVVLSVSLTGCDAADLDPFPFNIGGVRFCPTELDFLPDADGNQILTTTDDVFAGNLIRYCQDWNGDAFCGGLATDDPDGGGKRLEPRAPGCGEVTINTPPIPGLKTEAEWALEGNWDTDFPALVFTLGVGQANGVSNPACGLVSPGTHGFANHA